MKTALTITICAALFAATACDKNNDGVRDSRQTDTRTNDMNRTPTDASANRSTMLDLGTKQLGSYNVHVYQTQRAVAGRDAEIEVDLGPSTVAPSSVRGWVGTESGNTDAVNFDKKSDNRWRANVKVPEAGASTLWIEIDGQRTSVELRR